MPWWGKSSSREDKKKVYKESLFDSIHRRFRNSSQERANSRSGGSRACSNDIVSERGCLSRLPSRSPSPSKRVSRCQSFVVRPHAQPLPLPGVRLAGIGRTDSGISSSPHPALDKSPEPLLYLPLPRPGCVSTRPGPTDAEGDLATASISSDSSIESDEPSESRPLSPLASDCENGNKCAANSPTSVMHKDQFSIFNQKTSRKDIKSATLFLSNQILSTSPKSRPLSTHMQNIQIPHHGALCYTPDSTMSSPSRSPMRACGSEKIFNSGFWAGKTHSDMNLVDSGHCSSPGSGQNSVGGDMSGQLFWQHNRCSPECSPIPSPRMTSPGPSSRIHSGAVTPIHPQAGGVAADSPSSRRDDGKQQSHRLPLPPITISNTGPFPPAYSTSPTSSVLRSPGRQENPPSPGSRWKKGRLLGRGTFGHVYLGFNRESGEMCAMKEVLLLSDDVKSKESAQQLGQEIALLSRLRHPNIVQYYGTETVEDKLYIYLEYVSGGSIHKLLQEYGQFGELAIRSYTQQILSGLAYLHAKNTIHRDIKGANLLVDPNGRVKLADFGMAKHISGQPCPLSLKGSPYWMAPEVIRNSSGCNLAIDIWSLGCTVLEMATAKPPWSQYEGVAAMFKIGNSKELPAIPDHLSDEGKGFVRLCLQRNPLHRPTAAQLLEHPFVNNAAQVDRSIPAVHPSEAPFVVTNGVRSMDIGNTRKVTCLESEGVAIRQSRVSKTTVGSSDPHMPRNISCPVSPIGSPLLHSRSPQHMSGRMSPSPISSPLNLSGSSTPITGGNGAIPYHHIKQPTYLQEGIGTIQRSNNSFYTNSSIPYQEPKPDPFRRMQQASHVFRDMISSENAAATKNQFGKPSHVDPREFNDGDGQSVLEDRSSQQVLRDHIMLSPSLDLNPSLPVQGRTVGI